MKYKLLFFVPLFIALLSCSEEEVVDVPEATKGIIGYWVNQKFGDTIYSYDRADKLKDGDYGFGIQENGEFLERANSGWCGTPPIAYSDYKGKWAYKDSILTISVAFWGGTAHYTWKVLSVDEDKLSLSVLEADYKYEDGRGM